MNPPFMLMDLAKISEAVLAFAVIAVLPGYVVAWYANLLGFRDRLPLTRLAIAVPVSIGFCPSLTYLIWRFIPPAIWLLYGACGAVFVALVWRERQTYWSASALRGAWRHGWIFIVIVAAWVALVELTLSDLPWGDRLYFPTVTYDYSLRATVTSAITRGGLPPQNPFFYPGRSFTMHYHYFWLALCSLAEQMTGSYVSSRHALAAGTIWSGIGLIALIGLYMRFFQDDGARNIRRRTLLAIALLSVTGLDILPVLFIEYRSNGYFADLEWWNDQVAAWIVTSLWTPHHLAGLVACLMGFLLLWNTNTVPRSRDRLVQGGIAGTMFASAVGLSIYVTLVFAIFLMLWMVVLLARGRRAAAALIAFAGTVTIVLTAAFLQELLGNDGGSGPSVAAAFPLKFAVRPFQWMDRALGLSAYGWKANVANFLLLPLNYVLELGFFFICGIVQCRRMWHDRKFLTENQLCAFTLASTSVAVCTFISSNVLTGNDLGWRGFLLAQFILLIWGAELLGENPFSGRGISDNYKAIFLITTLIVGVTGSVYALTKIRFYPVISDFSSTPLYSWLSPDRNLGARTFAMRAIYEELRRRTPATAIFQHNPRTDPEDLFHGIYADRQVAAETMSCGVFFGGDAKLCQSRIGTIDALFENPKAFSAAQIDEVCGQLSIDVLIAKDTDKIWGDQGSWIWHRTAIVENHYAKAFLCGPRIALRAVMR